MSPLIEQVELSPLLPVKVLSHGLVFMRSQWWGWVWKELPLSMTKLMACGGVLWLGSKTTGGPAEVVTTRERGGWGGVVGWYASER